MRPERDIEVEPFAPVDQPVAATHRADWYPDPFARYEHRYHNGVRWTADVATDGERSIDPFGVEATPPGATTTSYDVARHPARGVAMWAMIFGLVGVSLAWTPFLFVVGGGLAIAALTLGIVALRRIREHADVPAALAVPTRRSTRVWAIAGIALAPLALGLCVLGVHLTGVTLREFDEYEHPGRFDVTIDSCVTRDGVAEIAGSIHNLDDRTRSYLIRVEVADREQLLDSRTIRVDDVSSDSEDEWGDSFYAGEDTITCTLGDVTGPYPFDLDPASA